MAFFSSETSAVSRKKLSCLNSENWFWLTELGNRVEEGVWSIEVGSDRVLYFNRAAQILYGRDRKEFEQSPELWLEVIDPKERDRVVESLCGLLEANGNPGNSEPVEIEYYIIQPSGERCQIRHKFWLVCNDNGTPGSINSILTEIGDRSSKIEVSPKFEKILDKLPIIFYQYILHPDRSDEFYYISSNYRDRSELEIKNFQKNVTRLWDFVHPEDCENFTRTLAKSAATLSEWKLEWRHLTPSGKIKWLSGTGIPEKQSNQDIVWYGFIQDITAQKREREALCRNREQLEKMVEQSTTRERNLIDGQPTGYITEIKTGLQRFFNLSVDLMYIAGVDGYFKRVNPACKSILGYTSAELLDTPFLNLVHEEDLAATIAEIRKLNSGEILLEFENRYRCKDGSYKWLSWRGTAIAELGLIYGMARDISDRKEAEAALRESEQKFQRLTDNVPGMIYRFQLDPQGEKSFGYVSSGCRELYELEAEAIAQNGELPFAQIHPEDRAAFEESIAISMKTMQPWHREWRNITPSGKLKWFKGASRPQQQGNGEIVWDGIVMDITELKQVEEALRANQHFIQKIAETSPNILYVRDLKQHHNIYANRDIAQMLGYTSQQIREMGSAVFQTLMHPEDFARFGQYYRQLQSALDGDIFEIEYRMKDPNDRWHWLLSRDTVFTRTPDGQPLQILGTAEDITEQKQATKELAKRAKLAALRSDIGFALSQPNDLSKMLSRCTEAIVKHLDAAFARVWTFNPEEKMLELQASSGIYTHINGAHARVPVGRFKIGLIAAQKQPHLTNDVHNDPQVSDKEWARREGMVAFAGYPLIVEDRLVGVMAIFARHPLREETLDALASVANEVGVAIELKKASEALRITSERLHLALEGSALGLWDWNIPTGETYFDPQWKKMLGYSVEEIENTHQSWQKLIHPEDVSRVRTAIDAHLRGATPVCEMEYRMLSQSGEWKWILSRGQIFDRDESGNPVRMTGTNRDISDRKASERALRESERRFRAIFNSSFQFTGLLEPNGTTIEANRTALDFAGIQHDDIVGCPFWEARWWTISPETQNQLKEAIARAAQGEFVRYEVDVLGKNGTLATLDFSIKPVFDSCDRVVLLIPEGRDITKQKLVREALALSLDRLNLALSAADDGLWDWNVVTGDVYLSPRWKTMLGYDTSEIAGRFSSWQSLVHPDDLPGAMARLHEHFEDCSIPYAIDWRMRTKSGQWKWILCQGKVVERDESGNPVRMTGIHKDITERKATEEALRKSQKQLQQAQRIAHIGSWEFDLASETVTWSEEVFRIFGLNSQQSAPNFSGHVERIHPSDRSLFVESVAEAIAHGTAFDLDFRIVRPDGSLRYINGRGEAVQDDRGSVVQLFGTAMDISDRKQTEATLRDHEEFLRSIYEGIDLGILIVDVLKTENSPPSAIAQGPVYEFRYAGFNPSMVRISQMPVEWLLGKTLAEALSPEVANKLRQRYLSCIEASTTVSFEDCLQIDELESWWLLTYTPLRNAQSEIYRIVVTATEITDRKLSEEALRRSETQYRELAQREELLNRLANQIRNSLELDTILQTTVDELRNLLEVDRCHFIWYRTHGDRPYWEIVCEAKDPSSVSSIGCYPSDRFGSIGQQLLNLEMLQVDRASDLQDSKVKQFLSAIGHQSVLMLPIQIAQGEIGVIACTRDREPKSWDAEDLEVVQSVVNQLAIAIEQAKLYTKSRESARLAHAKSLELEKTLSELQKTQANLIQAEKMSSLGQMVAGVAHEINNPVNFIYANLSHANDYIWDLLSLIGLYQEHYPQPNRDIADAIDAIELDYLVDDLPKLLESMKVGAVRIREIVKSLRTFSRLDEADVKRVNIHENIASTLMILQHRLKAQPNRPAIQVIEEYGKLPPIECYAGQLNQVFMNLIGNAIDALEVHGAWSMENWEEKHICAIDDPYPMPNIQHPTIRISTKVVNDNWVDIRIADNGIGMSQGVISKIFDPFYTTKPIGKGTGLGLSISYQIVVERHHGKLICASEIGNGTEFTIQIPLKQK